MKVLELHGNRQQLDGGAMFGNAPRALWSRWLTPDAEGRISLACRCLLLEHQGRLTLFEAGIGAFFEPSLRSRYGVVEAEHVLLQSLSAHGIQPADIQDIVLSHLHFDHAGGLLSSFSDGRDPTLVFPNARYIVGETAFLRAQQPHLRDRASFINELPALLQASGRLQLLSSKSNCSWFTGPLGSQIVFATTDGHTPGMLHAKLLGKQQQVFFCADLVPGVAWLHLPITMGYDRFPEALIDEKTVLFKEFERDATWLYFCHDPNTAMARITRNSKGNIAVQATTPRLDAWFDLDAP